MHTSSFEIYIIAKTETAVYTYVVSVVESHFRLPTIIDSAGGKQQMRLKNMGYLWVDLLFLAHCHTSIKYITTIAWKILNSIYTLNPLDPFEFYELKSIRSAPRYLHCVCVYVSVYMNNFQCLCIHH